MTSFNIAAFAREDYSDILLDIVIAPKAPYEPNVVTSALMGVLSKAAETGVFTDEQADYLMERIAVETGTLQKMVIIGKMAALAGKVDANEQLDEAFAKGVQRVIALNNGGLNSLLEHDAQNRSMIVLKVDENTTEEQFKEAFTAAGLATGDAQPEIAENLQITDPLNAEVTAVRGSV